MKKLLSVIFAVMFVLSVSGLSFASGSHSSGEAAIGGYCPVCIQKGKFTAGTADYSVDYKGKTYYFVGQKQKDMFLESPDKYLTNLEQKYMDLKKEAMSGGDHKKGSGHEKKGSGY